MAQDSHTVSRQFAAEILNVSVRTLDRHVKADKISAVRRGRELYFDEQELLKFQAGVMAQQQIKRAKKNRQRDTQRLTKRTASQTSPAHFPDVEQARAREQVGDEQPDVFVATEDHPDYDSMDAGFAKIRDELLRRSPEESIFKRLYEKADAELQTMRQQLSAAHYQVGQLEEKIKSMVPLITFKKQKEQLALLTSQSKEQEREHVQLQHQIKIEQMAKKVYALFLFFMVALTPILVILRVMG